MTAGSVFDQLAAGYDAAFTETPLGRVLRGAIWRRVDACFGSGDRVLELNCGTGEDAIHLAQRGVRVIATDSSLEMLEIAARKAAAAGVSSVVTIARLDLDALGHGGGTLAELDAWAPFDGALSNFGGLNCARDVAGVARGLAGVLRRGSRVVLCAMGRFVPWEWAWFLWRGDPARAFRRLRPNGSAWRGATVRYPSVRRVRQAFAPAFRLTRTWALGALLPPTYAGPWIAGWPDLLRRLNAWERRIETLSPVVQLADHFVLELERR